MKKWTLPIWLCCWSVSALFAQGSFKITSGAYVKTNGSTYIKLSNAHWDNNGTFTPDNGTVEMLGGNGGNNEIKGSAIQLFNNLTINRTSGTVKLTENTQVDGNLNFSNGNLDLNGHDLTLNQPNGILLGEDENSHITSSSNGEVIVASTLNNPSQLNPGNIGVNLTTTSNLGLTTIRRGVERQVVTGNTCPGIMRYFSIEPTNNSGLDATLRFHYLEAELEGLSEINLDLFRNDGSGWVSGIALGPGTYTKNVVDNWIEKTGLDHFSIWTIASNDTPPSWYPDADLDGWGGIPVTQCERPTGFYLFSELANGDGDCDDNDSDEHPNQSWYIDADGDGYGASSIVQCERPINGKLLSELIAGSTGTDDCLDSNPAVYPGVIEICNGLDDDCDGQTDENAPNTWVKNQFSGATITDVWMLNATTGWAVGWDGAIFHTTNGGTAWSLQSSGTTNFLNAVWGTDASNVWAVGAGGVILKYDGISWSAQSSGTTKALYSLWGSDASNVWVVGENGTIRKFNGTSWQGQSSGTTRWLFDIWGVDASNVWVVGDFGTIRKYNGSSWSAQTSGTTQVLNSIWGSDVSNIWTVGGDGTILKYNGNSWSAQSSGVSDYLYGVWGSNASNVWVVGSYGNIIKYNGTSWSAQTSGSSEILEGVWGASASNVWAVGWNGTILKYNGTSWGSQSSGNAEVLNGVWGLDPSNIWAVGGTGGTTTVILKYNGANWLPQTSGFNTYLDAIWGSDASNIWAVGSFGKIIKYNGTSWSAQTSGSSQSLEGVWGTSASNVWAVGYNGTILKYNGTSWSTQSSGTTESFGDVWGLDASNIWTVGTNGIVLKYNGTSWSAQSSGTSQILQSVWGSDASNIWAVGNAGTILKYNGTTWSAQPSGTTNNLYDVWGTDPYNVWATGRNGTILKYNGTTWTVQTSETNMYLYGVWGSDALNIWTVGQAGIILKYIPPLCPDSDNDGYNAGVDCDDNDPLEHPNQTWYIDADGDDYGASSIVQCLRPANGFVLSELAPGSTGTDDCDDADPLEHPGQTWYIDADGDDYGASSIVQCLRPTNGFVLSELAPGSTGTDDCNDGNSAINPAASEACNGLDDDCDGIIDEEAPNTWAVQTSNTSQGLSTLYAADANNAWAVGEAGTILYWNGSIWSPQTSGTSNTLSGVWGLSATDVWAVGQNGTILHWNGTAWSAQTSGTSNWFYDVWGIDATHVWAVGQAGVIRMWDGSSWTTQSSPNSTNIYDVWGTATNNVWAVGHDGIIHKWDGSSWSSQSSLSATYLACIWGTDANNIWTVGSDGLIFKWNGSTWTAQTSGTSQYFSGLWGIDANNIWAVGGSGTIKKYNGTSWYTQASGTSGALNDVYGTDADNVWVSGASGLILNYSGVATWYLDADDDDFGTTGTSIQACIQPAGYSSNNTDCDDADPLEHPGQTWYIDADGDDYGASSVVQCLRPANGFVLAELAPGSSGSDDCDDADPLEHPGQTWYIDADADGYGASSVVQCLRPANGFVLSELAPGSTGTDDCDDSNAAIHPGATEVCNSLDDDCDGLTDEGFTTTWYADADADTYGDPAVTTQACTQPSGYVANNNDCDDADPLEHPGQTWYMDADADDYGASSVVQCLRPVNGFVLAELAPGSTGTDDCNDANPAIHPGATETCNGLDDDCDGMTDEGVTTTWYADADGDTYGDPAVTTQACTQPSGYVANNTDCDDADPLEHPGQAWYIDADGDDYGSSSISQCLRPSNGFLLSELSGTGTDDCNDAVATIHPGASETCNGLDDDCDGQVDEGGSSSWLKQVSGVSFKDVWMLNANTGWAVGHDGNLFYTSNSGTTWVGQASGTTISLNSIWGSDASNVWAFGDNGTILKYDGTSWAAQTSGTSNYLFAAWGTDASNVWVVGGLGTILKYDGNSWVIQPSGTTQPLYGLWGVNASNIWAVGNNGTVLKYDGSSWSSQSSGTTQQLRSIWGSDVSNLWAVGNNGAILKYNGTSWTVESSGTTENLLSVWGHDASNIWAAGTGGTILKFNGTNWNTQTSGTAQTLIGISGINLSNIWAVGNSGTILKFNGTSWSIQTLGISQWLKSVWGSTASNVWSAGEGGAILKYNGTSWSTQTSGTTWDLNSLWGSSDGSNVWAVGIAGLILKYNGTSWSTQTSGTSWELRGIWGGNNSNIWVVGNNGTILKYDGSTWSAQSSGTTQFLFGVWGSDVSNIWAVGSGGTILKYDGTSWLVQASGTTEHLLGVWGSDASNVWAVGSGGTILKYDGTSWLVQASGTTQSLRSAWGSDASNVWASGDNGLLLKFNGTTWSSQSSGTNVYLSGLWGLNAANVWMVGQYGTISYLNGPLCPDADGDGFNAGVDCDDANPAIYPGAVEICNNLDDDCDGITDEGVTTTFYADTDSDTYGDPAVAAQACTASSGYVSDNTDCDDADPLEHPSQTWYIDADGDDYGALSVVQCLRPTNGFILSELALGSSGTDDCDDTNAAINPGAAEVCNGLDDNCNGQTDEGLAINTYYIDTDGDGYGNLATTQQACAAPPGFVADNTDCDDSNANIFPGATELCNGLDDDCDGDVDEGIATSTWYADADGDGFGDLATSVDACAAPLGWVANNTDCDDTNADVHPGAIELCNGIDDNCNGLIDDNPSLACTHLNTILYWSKSDPVRLPDYGTLGGLERTGAVGWDVGAEAPPIYGNFTLEYEVQIFSAGGIGNGDCMFGYSKIDPDPENILPLADNAKILYFDQAYILWNYNTSWSNPVNAYAAVGDIVTFTIERVGGVITYSVVGIASGNISGVIESSYTGPVYPITTFYNSGCRLNHAIVNGGNTSVPVTTNLNWAAVVSADGYFLTVGTTSGGTDILNNVDVGNVTTYDFPTNLPFGATIYVTIVPYNSCLVATGCMEESFTTCVGASWYTDTDGDGYGDLSSSMLACSASSGYVADNTDCDDTDANEFPGQTWYPDVDMDGWGGAPVIQCERPAGLFIASELANGIGDCNDNDPNIDNGDIWYPDLDNDGFGDMNAGISACIQPANYISDGTDCDDTNANVHPGGTETLNGLDDDCNGYTDENSFWVSNPAFNNTLCNDCQPGDMEAISDGMGGMIAVWVQGLYNSGTQDIYAQRIDANGNALWGCSGILVCGAAENQRLPKLTSDGSNGAIVTWIDHRNEPIQNGSFIDIYAQRINSAGVIQWTADGIPVSVADGGQLGPVISEDGNGGCYIVWNDQRPNSWGLYGQRIDAGGNIQWTQNGTALFLTASCNCGISGSGIDMVENGSGEAIVAFQINDPKQIKALRINGTGNVVWNSTLFNGNINLDYVQIVTDGVGGGIVSFNHRNGGNGNNGSDDHIYSQRVDANGVIQWGTSSNPVPICQTKALSNYHPLVADGNGGAILAWVDYRNGNGTTDIYSQKINASGQIQWPSNGILVKNSIYAGWVPTKFLVSNGAGGAFVGLPYYSELRVQQISSSGSLLWGGNGKLISNAGSAAFVLVNDNNCEATLGFFRSGSYDLVASKISCAGNLIGRDAYVRVSPKAFLQGPYNAGLMNDNLRSANLIPATEPYTGLGFTHVGGAGGETVNPSVFTITGNDAIVDWVFLQLRDKNNSATVLQTRSALIQRDGDIVDVDGVSSVLFAGRDPDDYFITVRHRNHLGVMSASALSASATTCTIDFTSIATYGANAQKNLGSGVMGLWAGNADVDGNVKYNGGSNDRVKVLTKVGFATPNNIVSGYHTEDVNMDGLVKYNGGSNDRVVILLNVGIATPNYILMQQLP